MARLGAVSAHCRGLDSARSLLVGEELLHELVHAHRKADGLSLAFEIEDERIACALRLPARLALDRVERPHDLARHGVGVREDRLPSVTVSPSPQATAGVGKVLHLHFLPLGFQHSFLTDIVTDIVTAKTRLKMQKKQISTERWRREKNINQLLSAVHPDEVDEGELAEPPA